MVPEQAAAGGALDAGELAAAEQAALRQELELLRAKLDAHPDVRRYAGARTDSPFPLPAASNN